MLRTLLISLVLLAACNKKSDSTTPATPGTGPEPGTGAGVSAGTGGGSAMCGAPDQGALTEEQCTCLGGRVNASKGGGAQAHCAAGETEVAAVRFGIEGGWCCRKP